MLNCCSDVGVVADEDDVGVCLDSGPDPVPELLLPVPAPQELLLKSIFEPVLERFRPTQSSTLFDLQQTNHEMIEYSSKKSQPELKYPKVYRKMCSRREFIQYRNLWERIFN